MDENPVTKTPKVLTVLGKRVTMIDPVRKVFVIDLLSSAQCGMLCLVVDPNFICVPAES